MARLGKNKLLETAVRALRAAGWQVRQLSPPNSFPTRLLMEKDGTQVPVCLYIWNLTHGGGSKRPKNEYRIQVTSGVHSFENQPGSVTLILGWGARFGVFAAFDVHCRSARLGSSPSIQIAQETLSKAG